MLSRPLRRRLKGQRPNADRARGRDVACAGAVVAVCVAFAGSTAWAQPDAAPAPPGPGTVEGVTVQGAAPNQRVDIDKRSFSLEKDLQASTGSISDALRNLPSVAVDAQGVLSVRGDPRVTILIDGKPAPQFEGVAGVDALQQLGADQFERVEVLTNPPVGLSPDGFAVINLISKASRGRGWTGSSYVTAGSAGLKRVGASFGYNSPQWAVSGSAGGNYQYNKLHRVDQRSGLDPASGRFIPHVHTVDGHNLTRTPTAQLTVTYIQDPKARLVASGQYTDLLLYGRPYHRFEDFSAEGFFVGLIDRYGRRRLSETDSSVSLGWRRALPGEGHELSLDLIRNDSRSGDHTTWTTVQAIPRTTTPVELLRDDSDRAHSELRLVYSRPAPGGGDLKVGVEYKLDRNLYDHRDGFGLTEGTTELSPALANRFLFRQRIGAAHLSFERSFGELELRAGLRVEDVRLRFDQETVGRRLGQDYMRPFPTLHLRYRLDDDDAFLASYSRRIQRPQPQLFNPLPILLDPKDILQGNPDLRPQRSDAFELGYDGKRGPHRFQATLYHRRNADELAPLLTALPGGVFLQSFGNLDSSRVTGLELVLNGRLTPEITYSVNADIYRARIQSAGLGVATGSRSGRGLSGRGNLNWQASSHDLFQLNVYAGGRRLLAQGYIEPVWTVNLGYRRRLNDRLTLTATAQDLFASNRYKRRIDTPILRERFEVVPVSRAFLLRLDYRFGATPGKTSRDPGFEYENPSPPVG